MSQLEYGGILSQSVRRAKRRIFNVICLCIFKEVNSLDFGVENETVVSHFFRSPQSIVIERVKHLGHTYHEI